MKGKHCKVCNHQMKMHKDICDSQGKYDGKHITCLAPAKKQNDFLTKAFGGIITCSCDTKKVPSVSLV